MLLNGVPPGTPFHLKFEVRSSNEEFRTTRPFLHSQFALRTSNFTVSCITSPHAESEVRPRRLAVHHPRGDPHRAFAAHPMVDRGDRLWLPEPLPAQLFP